MPLLSIDIAASYAKFQDALSAIERSAKKTASGLEGAFRGVNGALAGLGVTVSVGALTALVKSSIDAADHLNDLSKKTGIAVDVLGGIGFAAAQAGSNLDTVSNALGKLNKTIAEAGSGNKEAVEAFRSMGIAFEEGSGKLRGADKVLIDLAGKFEKFADSPEKAAQALAFFKKAGADMIPLLNDGGEALRQNIEYFQKYSGMTKELAEKSDSFNDALEKIKLLSGAAGNEIAGELLPTLSQIAAKMIAARESTEGFSGIAKAIGTGFRGITIAANVVIEAVDAVGQHIGALAAVAGRFAERDWAGVGNVIKDYAQSFGARVDRVSKFTVEVANGGTADLGPKLPKGGDRPEKPVPPRLPGSGTDPAVAKLAAELRELERKNDRERELMSERNDFLQQFYQQDLISIRDYYDARKVAADEALEAQVTNINKEIELVRGRRAKDTNEATQNEAKIRELIERRSALQDKATTDAIRRTVEQTEATKELKRAIEDVNTELLEQQGKSGEVAARRFDERNRQLRQRLEEELATANNQPDSDGVTTVRGSRALASLDRLRDITIAQGKLNELQEEGGRIQSDLAIASDRASIAAQNGSITELQSLRAVSDARAQAAVELKAVTDAYAEMAAQTGNPALVQRAKEMQVEVEKLAASADLVREKFQGVFENGFDSFFDKLASGTASVKDAFKALFSDIASDLSKIAIKDLGKQLFSKEGSLGGVVDFTSQLFGGPPISPAISALGAAGSADSAASAASGASGLATLAATTATTDTAMVTLAASANYAAFALDAAAAAAAGSAGSSGAESFIGLFEDFASFAAKGNIYASGNLVPFANGGVPGIVDAPTMFAMSGGRTGLMGEAGPEAIMPLGRDRHGQLAVRMVTSHGGTSLLPLTRDTAGRLAVRAGADSVVHQKFAKGGVPGFRIPDASRSSVSSAAAMTVPVDSGNRGGVTFITNVPQGTSQESASQIGARTAIAVQRANRRNN